ncbi:hypothetical protein Q9L58_003042 [Maublancomyces gigas]|uniref:GP-PDE domain-containing protein n=1 Tax=Discina gigas TaxID=1032678 RepID=A0ABR3GPX9_9PEZI
MSHEDSQALLGDRRPEYGSRLPQAIAHRGLKDQFPENSIKAFESAVKAGVAALETDLHLSRDGVVMISHDATLKRCFGVAGRIIDFDYAYLKTLRTLEAPHVPMSTLREVLELMCQPAVKDIWLLLDIKVDNDADDIIRLIGETLRAVGGSAEFWGRRVVLGCWTLAFIPLCERYLPGFPIAHIGFSIPYAREFLKIPDVSFNLFYAVLDGPKGEMFLRDAHAAGRNVYTWTVNDAQVMRWAIAHSIDSVCTDNPVKFLDVCDKYQDGQVEARTYRNIVEFMCYRFVAGLFSYLFRYRYGLKELESGKIHLASAVTRA